MGLKMIDAVVVESAATGELDMRHPACVGDSKRIEGPPVQFEMGPEPPTCSMCGDPLELADQIIRAPIDRDQDEGDDGPTLQ